jgi:hypothetical protein
MTSHNTWRKSSFSGADNNCVELSMRRDTTGIRDSKNPEPALRIDREAWLALLALIRA